MKGPEISTVSEIDNFVINGLLCGKSEAFERLYSDHFPMVSKMIIQNTGTLEEAQDIFQEAVMVLYDKIQCGGLSLTSQLRTYIYAICRRLWLKQLKERGKMVLDQSALEEDIPDIPSDLEMHEQLDLRFSKMKRALEALGDPCKGIIRDFYINGMNMQDIGDKYGYTNSDSAKNQKYKCLQRLKKLFFTE